MAVTNTTSNNLRKYKENIIRKVKNLVTDSIEDVELMANRDLKDHLFKKEEKGQIMTDKKGKPILSSIDTRYISVDKEISNGGLTGEVGVFGDNPLAAYLEFGTGLSAVKILAGYPDWVRKIAREFYVNGKGTLQGKPYLFNNFLVVEEKFKKKLNEILSEPFVDT